jgi:hypothetical protein
MTETPPLDGHDHAPDDHKLTDDEWNAWKDYADQVTVDVRFMAGLGEDNNDESWTLVTDGAAWPKDWLTRELVDLAAADAPNSCCGRGNYILEARDHKHEWGASAAAFEVLLTLRDGLMTEVTWVALGALGTKLAGRLREMRGTWELAEDRIDDPYLHMQAVYAVSRAKGVSSDSLEVKSAELTDDDGLLVEVADTGTGRRYTVEVRLRGTGVRMMRIRKVTEPDGTN